MAARLRVALLIESYHAYGQNLRQGIGAYAREHGPWSFYHHARKLSDSAPAQLKQWGCHGLLARIESRKLVRQIRELNLPAVDLFALHELAGIPAFDSDHRAVARLAAAELLQRGFEHFAYCGFEGLKYSDQRGDHFVRHLAELGHEVDVFRPHRQPSRTSTWIVEERGVLDEDALAVWLRRLPKPVGLMACNDIRAQQVLNACTTYGIAVPEDVAVIGADNDEVLCELSNPPLSSIDPNAQKIGYEGAALLHRMIEGYPVTDERRLIEPRGVVTRLSTDVMATADRDVAAAARFIREHACDGITVEDVLEHVQLSRSTLERKFSRHLGCTPGAEINRVRLGRVKQLLRTTEFTVAKIAELTGFKYVESMCFCFRNSTGLTPGQFRKQPP